VNTLNSNTRVAVAKEYATPTLIEFGTVHNLTAVGCTHIGADPNYGSVLHSSKPNDNGNNCTEV